MKIVWKQVLVSFVLGVMVGAAGVRWCAPYYFHRHWGGKESQARLLERFDSKLKLTPEQRSQVAEILDGKRQKIDALRAEIRPKFEEIRSSTSAEIRGLLTPEQQKKFDAMQIEWEAQAKKRYLQQAKRRMED